MNAFYEHHKNHIRFRYGCFDRILLNGTIQPFQQEQRVVGFFTQYRNLYPVRRDCPARYRDAAATNNVKDYGVPNASANG
jgi:hypothetical protein